MSKVEAKMRNLLLELSDEEINMLVSEIDSLCKSYHVNVEELGEICAVLSFRGGDLDR